MGYFLLRTIRQKIRCSQVTVRRRRKHTRAFRAPSRSVAFTKCANSTENPSTRGRGSAERRINFRVFRRQGAGVMQSPTHVVVRRRRERGGCYPGPVDLLPTRTAHG